MFWELRGCARGLTLCGGFVDWGGEVSGRVNLIGKADECFSSSCIRVG